MNFFRVQGKGISLEEMQAHKSACGSDWDKITEDGLCAADSVTQLRAYLKQADFRPQRDDEDTEIIIFSGKKIGEVYDGVLAYPEKIIERVSLTEFVNNDRFCDYE
jgi:hypothetical protein